MTKVLVAIDQLKAVADFEPEFEGSDVDHEIREAMADFIAKYPSVTRYTEYLEFLRLTGGAFVDHSDFSLAIYGFGGDVVTSFHEPRLFLDRERYFHFGDVFYPSQPEPIQVLAFDFRSERDLVYLAADEVWVYSPCADSFIQLLSGFANGIYPGLST